MLTRHILPIASTVFLFCGTGLAGAAKIKAPTEPSNLTVKPLGVNSFELTWKDNSNNETGWDIFAALRGTTPVHYQWLETPNINTFVVITNELPGKEISFQVAAYSGTTAAPKSSKRTSIVSAAAFSNSAFSAPSKLRVQVVDDGQVRLLWKDNATRETGYQIEYKLASAKDWAQLGTRSPGVSFSVPITGFLPLTSYMFRVRAYNTYGGSPVKFTGYSKVVTAKTKAFQAPSDLVTTPEADGAFSFKWKDNSSVEAGFELQRKVGTADFVVMGTVPANKAFTDPVPGFALDTDHQFRLRGYRVEDGKTVYSGFSNVVSAKSTTLSNPATLAGIGTSDTSLTVTWTAPSLRATGYSIDYREAGTTVPFTTISVAKVLTAAVSNLSPGKLYEIRLKAVTRDFLGNVTASSAYTPSIEVRTKDGIFGDLHPPIFWGSSFLYPVQVSRASALTDLTVTGLPTGLVYDTTARTINGISTDDGVKTVVLKASFSDASVVTRNLILRIIRPPAAPLAREAFTAVQLAPAANSAISLTGKFEDPDTTSAARLSTSSGVVDIILYPLATPDSVTNFLSYLNNHRYDNSFFHRSVADAAGSLYIVQGGGYQYTSESGFTRVTKAAAILNEPGISNLKGTVAMAKIGGNPNSATSEFFINLSNTNASNLDAQNEGFTVFGRVSTPTLAVMEGINALPKKNYTVLIGTSTQPLSDVPIISPSTAVPIDPALLVKVPTATIPPILTYEVLSQNTAVATASLSGTMINVTGVATGTTTIEVKATDLDGQTVTQNIPVTVP
jgi:cyclophilin family peptidyl-prolyl cis-trans isomerase